MHASNLKRKQFSRYIPRFLILIIKIVFFFLLPIYSRTNYLDLGKTTRIATKRYMAPELLDGTINMDSFDELKMTDIYSLSLVFWEMCRLI